MVEGGGGLKRDEPGALLEHRSMLLLASCPARDLLTYLAASPPTPLSPHSHPHANHQVFPERVYDVGIAEQHAVTFAAGLACEGLAPFVAIYSSFMQRGYDQVVHDVSLQNLPGGRFFIFSVWLGASWPHLPLACLSEARASAWLPHHHLALPTLPCILPPPRCLQCVSRWTARGWWAPTAPPTAALSTPPSWPACPTW